MGGGRFSATAAVLDRCDDLRRVSWQGIIRRRHRPRRSSANLDTIPFFVFFVANFGIQGKNHTPAVSSVSAAAQELNQVRHVLLAQSGFESLGHERDIRAA